MLAGMGRPSPGRTWAPDPLLRTVLDASPAAMGVVDSAGTLVHCNAAWRALAADAAPFGDLGSLVASADHEGSAYLRRLGSLEGPLAMAGRRLAHAVQDAFAGRPTQGRVEYRRRRPDGETPFAASVSVLPGERLALVQHLDVSDRERAEDAEAAALQHGLQAEALRAWARRLERRIAAVGQDLHTPVTPVRLELHLLQSGALGAMTPGQAKAVAVASRNVQRWAEAEEAFLRIPAEIAPPKVAFDLAELVRQAVEARQTEALQAGVRLSLHSVKALPVSAQPDAMRDVLDRFLDAALAASPAGSTVAIEASPQDGAATVSVRDSGPGMGAREVKATFEPWSGRGLHDAARDLSLHYARILAEADRGHVWAESDGPGQGVLLGMALPLLAAGGFDDAGAP